MTRSSRTLVLAAAALLCAGGLLAQDTTAPAQAPAPAVKLTSIESVTTPEGRVEISIKTSGRCSMEIFELGEPRRLVMDLKPIESIEALPLVEVNAGGVLRVRAAMFQPGVARVVFDLSETAPAHSIGQTEDGFKLGFWMEAGAVPVSIAPVTPPVEAPAAPAPVPAQAPAAAPAVVEPSTMFVQLTGAAGMGPLNTDLSRDVTLYGQSGRYEEIYKSGLTFGGDLAVGKRFMGGMKIKAGLMGSFWMLGHKGDVNATLPSPIAGAAARSVSHSETLKGQAIAVQAFGLFRLLRTDKMQVWLGPAAGYAFGKYEVYENVEIVDAPPYTTLTVEGTTAIEDKVSGVVFSLLGDLEYKLSEKLAFVGSLRVPYFSPSSDTLKEKLNLLQVQLGAGIVFSF